MVRAGQRVLRRLVAAHVTPVLSASVPHHIATVLYSLFFSAEQAEGPGDTAKGWPRTFKEEVQQKEGEVLTRLEGIKSKL